MKIGIIGCAGRMGKTLIEETVFHPDVTLTGGTVRAESEFVGIDLGTLASINPVGTNASSNVEHLVTVSDAIIDFTHPQTSLEVAALAAKHRKILVCGTTGFTAEQHHTLEIHATRAPIVWSANMSIGVNLLFALTEQVAGILDDSYDIEILEMHHYQKIDAPSGTALALGNAAAKGRKVSLAKVGRKSREGITGKRPRGEIGFATLRGGDVIGDHTVLFAGDGERIEISHKASNRKIYAKGAIRAALWLKNKPAGLYSMGDVLLHS